MNTKRVLIVSLRVRFEHAPGVFPPVSPLALVEDPRWRRGKNTAGPLSHSHSLSRSHPVSLEFCRGRLLKTRYYNTIIYDDRDKIMHTYVYIYLPIIYVYETRYPQCGAV